MRRLAILLFLGCTACGSDASQPGQAGTPLRAPIHSRTVAPGEPAPVSPTLAQLRAAIGTPSCTDSSQCHTVPVGARGCGGPESYLAWSSKQTDGEALRIAAKRYEAERKAQIAERGEISDCRFLGDPGATCSAGVCQLGQGAPVAR